MHGNEIIYALICTKNHVLLCQYSMLSEPRYDLRKRIKSKEQQNSVLLLIQKFEKLSIHEMNEENLSKKIK